MYQRNFKKQQCNCPKCNKRVGQQQLETVIGNTFDQLGNRIENFGRELVQDVQGLTSVGQNVVQDLQVRQQGGVLQTQSTGQCNLNNYIVLLRSTQPLLQLFRQQFPTLQAFQQHQLNQQETAEEVQQRWNMLNADLSVVERNSVQMVQQNATLCNQVKMNIINFHDLVLIYLFPEYNQVADEQVLRAT